MCPVSEDSIRFVSKRGDYTFHVQSVEVLYVCVSSQLRLYTFVYTTIEALYVCVFSTRVDPVLSWDKCVLLKDHNTVRPVRLEPAALQS